MIDCTGASALASDPSEPDFVQCPRCGGDGATCFQCKGKGVLDYGPQCVTERRWSTFRQYDRCKQKEEEPAYMLECEAPPLDCWPLPPAPIDTLDALSQLRDITGLTWRLEGPAPDRKGQFGGRYLAVYESHLGHPSPVAGRTFREALRYAILDGIAESEGAFSEGRSFLVYTQNTPEQRAALRALLRRIDAAASGATPTPLDKG